MASVFHDLLGDTLVKNDGTETKTEELSHAKGAVIGLYFSAHWCPPCRGFTPKLSTVYKEIKDGGHDFEIVFVSWDGDETQFKSYHGEMPWLALPYASEAKKEDLGKKYEVGGIPSLVLLDASSGDTISKDGRGTIVTHGAAGFPFTEERLKECKREKEEKQLRNLLEIASCPLPVSTFESEVDLHTLTRSCEALAVGFFKGRHCQGSNAVIPLLVDAHKSLGKSKLDVIIVPLEDMTEFDEEMTAKMEGVPMIKYGEKSKEIVKKFESVLEINTPHVFIIGACGESLKIHAENAAVSIYRIGVPGFPWSTEALDALKAKEEALKEEVKAKQKDLEFFAPDEKCHVVDKNGATVPLATLQSKDVVGIYFSAHWCGPCRMFTPQLVELYNKCKEQGKSFEVVFVSSDQSKAEFDEYYAEMPWNVLPFDDRALKSALSDVYKVQGIPTLILLNGKGDMITESGRSVVKHGVDYFPWSKEDLARAEANA